MGNPVATPAQMSSIANGLLLLVCELRERVASLEARALLATGRPKKGTTRPKMKNALKKTAKKSTKR
jgi:hypothetical protein